MNTVEGMNVKQADLLAELRKNLKSLLDSDLNDFVDIADGLIQQYKGQKYKNEQVYLRRSFNIPEISSSKSCNQDLS